jgi:hypothetical protein
VREGSATKSGHRAYPYNGCSPQSFNFTPSPPQRFFTNFAPSGNCLAL